MLEVWATESFCKEVPQYSEKTRMLQDDSQALGHEEVLQISYQSVGVE